MGKCTICRRHIHRILIVLLVYCIYTLLKTLSCLFGNQPIIQKLLNFFFCFLDSGFSFGAALFFPGSFSPNKAVPLYIFQKHVFSPPVFVLPSPVNRLFQSVQIWTFLPCIFVSTDSFLIILILSKSADMPDFIMQFTPYNVKQKNEVS